MTGSVRNTGFNTDEMNKYKLKMLILHHKAYPILFMVHRNVYLSDVRSQCLQCCCYTAMSILWTVHYNVYSIDGTLQCLSKCCYIPMSTMLLLHCYVYPMDDTLQCLFF